MLLTKWSRSFDREHPLPEYPRPQFVRDSYLSLNGTWKYVIKNNSGRPMRYLADITVPFSPETEISGVCRALKPTEYLFYLKKFRFWFGFSVVWVGLELTLEPNLGFLIFPFLP